MLIPLIRIKMITGEKYILQQIYVNPVQIVYISEDYKLIQKLKEGKISLDLHVSTGFTKIKMHLNGYVEEITVVGAPDIIEQKINSTSRRLLKG